MKFDPEYLAVAEI